MKKRLLSIFLISTISIMLIGCGDKNNDKTTGSNDTLSKEDSIEANSKDKSEEDQTTENKDKSATEETKHEVSFSIYSADVDTLALTKIATLKIDENKTLTEKIDILAKELSVNVFDSLPINVEKVSLQDNKKIAYINLEESNVNKDITDASKLTGPNWAASKLQGSTGAAITKKSLVETFLQRDYKGSWIDGIYITYKGASLDFAHASELNEIIYR